MNLKCLEKFRARRVHGLALAAWLWGPCVMADDGNLTQQLHIQQQKSGFQLMLEQVQERARRRAVAGPASATADAPAVAKSDLGDRTQSVRLAPIALTDPMARDADEESLQRLRARQAFERDQQRILDHRQQRRALIADPDIAGPAGIDAYAIKRRELVRYNTQQQQQTLQRKLRP